MSKNKLYAAFIYDVQLTEEGGKFYSQYLRYDIWQRYLNAASRLKVLGRPGNLADTGPHNLSSGPGVTFCVLPNLSTPGGQLLKRRAARARMRQELKDVDLIIARLPSELGILGVQVGLELKKPVVTEVVACGFQTHWNHGSLSGKLWAPLVRYRTKKAIRSAPFAAYVTWEYLQRMYPTSGVQVGGLSNVSIDSAPSSVLSTRSMRITQERRFTTFGTIGTLTARYKGIDTAIRALAELKNELGDFQYRIAGPGDPSRLMLLAEKLGIAERVRFDGVVSRSEIFSWIDALDIYLQPSRTEGLPRALIEAQSRGVPALGSTAGGIPELLPKWAQHRPGDYKGLSRLIKNILASPDKAKALSLHGLNTSAKLTRDKLEEKRSALLKLAGGQETSS